MWKRLDRAERDRINRERRMEVPVLLHDYMDTDVVETILGQLATRPELARLVKVTKEARRSELGARWGSVLTRASRSKSSELREHFDEVGNINLKLDRLLGMMEGWINTDKTIQEAIRIEALQVRSDFPKRSLNLGQTQDRNSEDHWQRMERLCAEQDAAVSEVARLLTASPGFLLVEGIWKVTVRACREISLEMSVQPGTRLKGTSLVVRTSITKHQLNTRGWHRLASSKHARVGALVLPSYLDTDEAVVSMPLAVFDRVPFCTQRQRSRDIQEIPLKIYALPWPIYDLVCHYWDWANKQSHGHRSAEEVLN